MTGADRPSSTRSGVPSAADLPDYLADLERLVNIDCGVVHARRASTKSGAGSAGFLRDLGADVDVRPDPEGRLGDTVVATFAGRAGGPRVLLIGHMDTVFDPGTAAERPFRDRRRHRPRARASPT